jgi:hypothetical protein
MDNSLTTLMITSDVSVSLQKREIILAGRLGGVGEIGGARGGMKI